MNIPLLIIPFLLNSLATTNSNKVGTALNISADEIACNYCWLYEDQRVPHVFNPRHLIKCDNSKVVIKKRSEYRCVVNLAYKSIISYNTATRKATDLLQYEFGLTATKTTDCKHRDSLCALSLYNCGQSYICCDENYCNSPNNLKFHITAYKYDDGTTSSECLAMSFKNKKINSDTNPIVAKEPVKLLKTHYCNENSANSNHNTILPYIMILISYIHLLLEGVYTHDIN